MTELSNLKEKVRELKTRINDFERLFTILRSVSSSLQIEKILELIISEAVSLCRANHGSIILFDPDKMKIAKTLIRSEDSKRVKIDNYLNNLLAGWVYDNLKTLLTDNLIDTFNEKLIKEKYRDITSVLSVPITEKENIFGVINLVSLNDEYRFGDREIQLIETLAIQCVNIIVSAKLRESLFQETSRLRKELDKKYAFREVIGNSPKLREVFSLLERIIPTDARILHYNGPHKDGPFVGVDCGAFPENLLESELFGYVKGAFTGATKDKPGLYEEAQNGTLFLDEITNMPVNIQSKLLRALQEGEIRPVGSTKVKKMHVRVLSAASDSLAQKMQEGKFRQDLYYRLNVVNVKLPPLRERYEDIPILANHFLEKYAKKYHKNVAGLNSETLNILESYPWPGNIRELENIMERIIILIDPGKTNISTELLPSEIRTFSPNSSVKTNSINNTDTLSIKDRQLNYEKKMLIESLTKNNWNQSLAAKELDIHESTIRYKMRKFGIKKE